MTSLDPMVAGETNTKPEKKETRILGVPVSAIVLALFSAIVGSCLTIFTTWWTSKEPHLTKRVLEVLPFKGEKGETGILNFSLSSDGGKEAEDVEGLIKVDGSTIEDVRIVPEIVHPEKTVKGDSIAIKVKTLNVGDTLQVSALVKKAIGLPTRPIVDFRGKGVIAEDKPVQNNSATNAGWVALMGLLYLPLIVLSLFRSSTKEKSYEEITKKYDELTRKSEANHEELIRKAEANYDESIRETEADYEESIRKARADFDEGLLDIRKNYQDIIVIYGKTVTNYQDEMKSMSKQCEILAQRSVDTFNQATETHESTMKTQGILMEQIELKDKAIERLERKLKKQPPETT